MGRNDGAGAGQNHRTTGLPRGAVPPHTLLPSAAIRFAHNRAFSFLRDGLRWFR